MLISTFYKAMILMIFLVFCGLGRTSTNKNIKKRATLLLSSWIALLTWKIAIVLLIHSGKW
jgi:hypothetical protein